MNSERVRPFLPRCRRVFSLTSNVSPRGLLTDSVPLLIRAFAASSGTGGHGSSGSISDKEGKPNTDQEPICPSRLRIASLCSSLVICWVLYHYLPAINCRFALNPSPFPSVRFLRPIRPTSRPARPSRPQPPSGSAVAKQGYLRSNAAKSNVSSLYPGHSSSIAAWISRR